MAQKRFIRRGVARIFYLKTVANPATGPTRAEIVAGEDITGIVASITGFAATSTAVPTPDMASRFDSTIPGGRSISDSSVRVYDDEEDEAIEALFPIDDEAFVYFMRKGDKPGTPTGDLFPTNVAARTPNWTTDMSPADNTIQFTITGDPQLDLVIPTLV